MIFSEFHCQINFSICRSDTLKGKHCFIQGVRLQKVFYHILYRLNTFISPIITIVYNKEVLTLNQASTKHRELHHLPLKGIIIKGNCWIAHQFLMVD
jgi:hypothetical protein